MRFIITLLVFIITAVSAHAQVVPDGTMGPPRPLNGPDFDIRAEYGHQAGANLFHSFSQFNINTDESATFSGPASVKNIISRVTGGNSSWIDGTLRSAIDGADMYLLNPAGVMFGPNASLDLSGSFHASTADYLRMGENERFYTEPLEGNVLSASAPAAFGFLAPSDEKGVAPISLDETEFSVNDGKTISLIGGDITIKNGDIAAPGGRINLASVASAGEAIPIESDLDISSFEKLGDVTLSDESNIDLSLTGIPNGDIFIRGGQFAADESVIRTRNWGDEKGGVIDIRANDLSFTNTTLDSSCFSYEETGRGGDIVLKASDSIRFTNAIIRADAHETGDGSDVFIKAHDISLTDSKIYVETYEDGNSGTLTIEGGYVSLEDSSLISCYALEKDQGNNGDVYISASESFSISSGSMINNAVAGPPGDKSDAGDIDIKSKNISLTDGGVIASTTYGDGIGGDITLEASEKIRLEGRDDRGESSRIVSSTYSEYESAGNAGSIDIKAGTLSLGDGGSINASTDGQGNAYSSDKPYGIRLDVGKLEIDGESFISSATNFTGDGGDAGPIEIAADESVNLRNNSSVTTSSEGGGNAAPIMLETPRLYLETDSLISSASNSQGMGGHAGTVEMNVSTLELATGASVSSESRSESGGGNAGKIIVSADDSVRLSGSSSLTTNAGDTGGGQISVNAENSIILADSAVTSSVGQGQGQGGDITADAETVVMNSAAIAANADQGDGGAVFIRTENFIKSSGSSVTASSNRGNEGIVKIEAPDLDISSSLTILPGNLPDAAHWMKIPCAARTGEDVSRFVIKERDGIPTGFDDWQASPPTVPEEPGFYPKGNFAGTVRSLENKKTNIPDALILSHAYSALGHYRKALAGLYKVLPLAEETNDPAESAMLFSTLGDLHLVLGDMKEAIEYVKKGLTRARESENLLVIASVLNNLGNLRAARKSYTRAMEAYQESLGLIGQENPFPLKSKVMINIAHAEFERGKHQNAVTAAEHALEQIKSQSDTYHKAADLISLSLIARKIRNGLKTSEVFKTSEVWLEQAAAIGEKIQNNRIVSYAYGCLAEYYEDNGQYPDAVKLTRKAIFYAQQGYFPEILYRWQWQMGRLLRQEDDMRRAAEYYRNAIATLNPIRTEFFNGFRSREKTFEEKVKPVYLELAELLLEQAETPEPGDSDLAVANLHLKKARDTMELLKKAELQDFFRDECLTAWGQEPGAAEHIPSQTAVIYPIPLPDHLALLLILPDGMKHIRVPVNSEHLSSTAKEFRELLEETEDFSNDAMQLYDWLIRPAENELVSRDIDTLIIVPDGALRLIPFSALHDGEHFLVEKYAMGTVPAISLTDAGQIAKKEKQILLSGLSEAKEGFAPLKGVKKELQAIKTVMGGKILLDQEFTTENLKTEVRDQDYDIVHLSTHAVFGGSPEETFLLTYGDKLSMNGLEKIVGLKRFRENQLELLTLSACETALGDERAAFGLAGVAVKAGARSAVATLWSVDDKAAFLTVNEFYRQLMASGISKAKALQNAQKKLILQEEYEHPAFWAPFLLIGNWL
ncbi:CHAT domain-containing protein [Desulfococcaceae bacterium HSG8]|nr:CHAT domain-containing protein [Desulfococcaceae bacterium HSG8]